MNRRIILVTVSIFICFIVGCSQRGANHNIHSTEISYSNPIDAYFLAKISTAGYGVEYRELQDTYKGVWEVEFDNVIAWMTSKCQYQDDIDKLTIYVDSVEELITATRTVILCEWLEVYDIPQDNPDRNSWGIGTQSGLNQVIGEIYRNAAVMLIEHCGDYEYRNMDYSKEYYEQ